MKFVPRDYQILGYTHMATNKRCALWAGMGMGKTSTTIMFLVNSQLTHDLKPLILAPKRVAESVWPAECDKWDEFKHYKVVFIGGTAKQRIAALNTQADAYTINYENLPWLIDHIGIENWQFNTIIADEATRLKSFRLRQGGKRAQKLAKVAFSKVERFIELTGTPAPNGLIDLWGMLWFLDKGERLGRTFTAFKNRWFRYPYPTAFNVIPADHAKDEIPARIADLTLSLRPEDYFDVEAPLIVDVPAYLPPDAMALYKQMEKEMFFTLLSDEVEAKNGAARSIKCLQIANGFVYHEDKTTDLHTAKLDAMDSILEETGGEPVICVYHFKKDLLKLKERYPKGVEIGTNPATIAKWNKGEIPILFVHPASAGHGLNLQDGGRTVIMYSHWWDLEQYQQVIERIGPVRQMQSGHPRTVYIYNIHAVGTIDSLVIQSRTDKRSVQELLMEAARKC